MVVLFLAACSGVDDEGFFSSSGRYDQPSWGDTATDTGSDTGDTASGGDDGAPVFTSLVVSWEDYPNIGTVLQVLGEFTDDGDDFAGGTCYVDVYNPEYVDSFELDASTETGANVCLITGSTLTIAFEGLDETAVGSVLLAVQDSSQNVSAEIEASTAD
ncbi:hypothetical protein LBMAG42_38210 [Deltaproteobacteria bacterium]|nr:hypothetical protein LBMAG42_38210 [Deltaproteobacteria bacterium]